MLVEFRVQNFYSLRDEQLLSLVASKDRSLQDSHTQASGIKAAPVLLRSTVIYGANASGKSNLIKALQAMRSQVMTPVTAIQPTPAFGIQPFALDSSSLQQPTEFEVTFLFEGVRYQYGFAMGAQRVLSEYLLVYKAFKPQRWFERHLDLNSGKDVYQFGPGLKGPKHIWEGATRPNALFLSVAVQLNSEALRPVFQWFSQQLVLINEQSPLNTEGLAQRLQQDRQRHVLCQLLAAADPSILDIHLANAEPNQAPAVRFEHRTANGSRLFDWMDEAKGTRRLLALAGPVLDALSNGQTLLIDELDSSLHTLLVRELVGLFHNAGLNPKGAQLVFTSQDISLLEAEGLFRRDQIWLVKKDPEQASVLRALSEFSPRKQEALARGYLMGRYGGLPSIKAAFGITP